MGYAKNRVRNFMGSYFSFIGLLLVVIIFHVLTEGRLISSRNMMNIFNNFFSIGLGSVGVMFLMSLGELDLSVGAILGFSAAIGAFSAEIHTVWILPACLLTGLLMGSLNGVLVIFYRNTGSLIHRERPYHISAKWIGGDSADAAGLRQKCSKGHGIYHRCGSILYFV